MEPEPSVFSTVFFIVLSLLLVALNGFFVAAEFAIVKVRRSRLAELADRGIAAARVSMICVDHLDEYLSATQLGITLVSLALGWIGEESFYSLILIFFPEVLANGHGTAHAIAIGCSFFVITLLHVVLGELVPKSMAIQQAEKITLWVAPPLRLFYRLARPLIRAFTSIANVILHRLGYHGLEEEALSEEELKIVMKESHEEGVITDSEAQIINRALSFSDKRISEIMVPVSRLEYLSLSKSLDENLRITERHMFTRFPIAREGLESVFGLVHMKDALRALTRNSSNQAFLDIARPALFVDPGMRQDRLMKIFKDQRAHMALVRDPKTNSVLGLVTMEDILEELVGEILDEHGN